MNIEHQLLIEHSAKNSELIASFIEANPERLLGLLTIILRGDVLLSQRGAWCLSKFTDEFYVEFIPYLDFIFSEIVKTEHIAVNRNFSKVFFKLTNSKNVELLSDVEIDKIVDLSFGWVIDNKSKPAVVVFGMYTLMNLLGKRNWIVQNLKNHIEDNMINGLPSFRAAGRKVLKEIIKNQ
jgi:hypothetical protein